MGYILLVCIAIIIVSGTMLLHLSSSAAKTANTGKLGSLKYKHISGIPNYSNGVEVKLSFLPDRMKIDDKQFILISKMKGAEINSTKQLTEVQKSVIGRAVVGEVLLGDQGGIVGGMSGIGTNKKTETVILITIFFITKDGEDSVTIFSMEEPMFAGALLNIVKRINEQTGYKPKYLDNVTGEI